MSVDFDKLAEQEAHDAIKTVYVNKTEKGIGLYIGDDWKAILPCGNVNDDVYYSIVRDLREVVKMAVFRALCLADESGSISLSENGDKVGQSGNREETKCL